MPWGRTDLHGSWPKEVQQPGMALQTALLLLFLLLSFLLSVSSSAPRSHSHSSLPDPAATMHNPGAVQMTPCSLGATRLQSPCDGGADVFTVLVVLAMKVMPPKRIALAG